MASEECIDLTEEDADPRTKSTGKIPGGGNSYDAAIQLDDDEEDGGAASSSQPDDEDALPPRLQLARLQELAAQWRGECLSTELEAGAMLKWKCSRGHEFDATSEQVELQRFWCPHWICLRGVHPMARAKKAGEKPPAKRLLQMASSCQCTRKPPSSQQQCTDAEPADAAANGATAPATR